MASSLRQFVFSVFITVMTGVFLLAVTDAPVAMPQAACKGLRSSSPAIPVAGSEEVVAGEAADSVERAYQFLSAQMDRLYKSVVVVGEPSEVAYFPAVVGDGRTVSIATVATDSAHSGRTSLRITFDPRAKAGEGWAGVYFLCPQDNWGRASGRNLTGGRRLTLWARADRPVDVEFLSGGLNRPSGGDPRQQHADSFGPIRSGHVGLTQSWKAYTLDLQGHDLSSVINAFAILARWPRGAERFSIELDDVAIDLPGLDRPRFLPSYVEADCDTGSPPNAANTYDQALALLAFLARGQQDDLRRAGLLASALVEAQRHDRTFRDGRLRNAYAAGELLDPALGVTRLPGRWDEERGRFLEDAYAAGSDTGNLAWAAIALIQAHAILPKRKGDPYRQSALALADWIVSNTKVDDALGGYSAGLAGFEIAAGQPQGQDKLAYRSTEHNIDLVALFDLLADDAGRDAAPGKAWSSAAAHARKFVEAMWQRDASGSYLATGTAGSSARISTEPIPLDAQTWSLLGMRAPKTYANALDWALKNCRAARIDNAFDFNCQDGDGAWWEGTAQVAAALAFLGYHEAAAPLLARLRSAQLKAQGTAKGALPAASVCGLTTGFFRDWGPKGGEKENRPWTFTSAPHVGATAWYVLAARGRNPFNLPPGS